MRLVSICLFTCLEDTNSFEYHYYTPIIATIFIISQFCVCVRVYVCFASEISEAYVNNFLSDFDSYQNFENEIFEAEFNELFDSKATK